MNKIIISGGLIGLAVIILVIGYLIMTSSNIIDSGKLKVAATIYPLADIVSEIGGDQIELVNVLPPGASPHTFTVTPSTVKDLQGTEMLFAIGEPLDSWAWDLLGSTEGTEIYVVNEGITKHTFRFEHGHDHDEEADDHEEYGDEHDEDAEEHEDGTMDPHYWLSTNNVKIIAGNVATELSKLDPENAEIYQKNLLAYQAELDQVHEEIELILNDLTSRDLIVFHESWNYFADEFSLEIVGVFTTSPGKEPTPSELAELHDTAIEHGISAVFSEPQLSPETIRPFVEDLDLELYVLDPLGGIDERDSLINTLKYNAQTIQQAFGE